MIPAGLGLAPQAQCQSTIVTGAVVLRAIGAEARAWGELCDAAGLSPFLRPEWVAAHLRAFEPPRAQRLVLVRRRGQLLAALPLVAERAWMRGVPVRRLRAAANHHTLSFDLVAAPGGDRLEAVRALWRALAGAGPGIPPAPELRGWDVLELQNVAPGGAAETLLDVAQADGYPTGSWRSPIETRTVDVASAPPLGPGLGHTSPKFRRELRRTRRLLASQGALRFEAVPDASAATLDQFFALEAAGWKGGEGGNAILRKPENVAAFYRDLAQGAAACGRFVLHRLTLDGTPIALSYSLLGPGRCIPLRWCYDERFAAYGPGHLLIESILEDCARRGLAQFSFLGEAFAYEQKWAPQGNPHRFLYIFRPDWRGRLLCRLKFAGHT